MLLGPGRSKARSVQEPSGSAEPDTTKPPAPGRRPGRTPIGTRQFPVSGRIGERPGRSNGGSLLPDSADSESGNGGSSRFERTGRIGKRGFGTDSPVFPNLKKAMNPEGNLNPISRVTSINCSVQTRSILSRDSREYHASALRATSSNTAACGSYHSSIQVQGPRGSLPVREHHHDHVRCTGS